jgi:hypothetical protein
MPSFYSPCVGANLFVYSSPAMVCLQGTKRLRDGRGDQPLANADAAASGGSNNNTTNPTTTADIPVMQQRTSLPVPDMMIDRSVLSERAHTVFGSGRNQSSKPRERTQRDAVCNTPPTLTARKSIGCFFSVPRGYFPRKRFTYAQSPAARLPAGPFRVKVEEKLVSRMQFRIPRLPKQDQRGG